MTTPTLRDHLEAIRARFDHIRVGPPEWHENCASCATYADATAALAILDEGGDGFKIVEEIVQAKRAKQN